MGWLSVNRRLKPEYQHYLGSFLLQVSMIVAWTIVPFYTFQHLRGGVRAAALAYGVLTLSLGATCLMSVPFVSTLRNGLLCCLVGSIGFGVFYSTAVFANNMTAFCILIGLSMVFFGLAWPALQSWLGAQPDGKLRTQSFSYFNVAIGMGLTLGPFVAGVFYEIDFRISFLGVLLLSTLAAILFFTLPRETAYFGSSAGVADSDAVVTGNSEEDNGNEVYLYCGWLTNMLGWGLTGAVRTVYAGQVNQLVQRGQLILLSDRAPLHVFAAQSAPSAATLYSWMQTILSLGYFVAILAMGRTVRWQHRFWLLAASQALLGIAIWVLAGSHSLIVILMCHAVMGAFTGFGYMGSQCYSAANPLLKHRRFALNEGLSHSAGFVVPLAFAQLGTWYGMTWPFRITPLLLAAFIVLQLLSLRYARRRLARGVLSTQEA